MKKLYIIGTKTLADMVIEIAERCGYEVEGFFDDTTEEKEHKGKPILGPIVACLSNPSQYTDAAFVVAIGDNVGRGDICKKLLAVGLNVPPLIDPDATVMPTSIIGSGSLLFARSYVGTSTLLGNGNILFPGVTVTHHTTVGDYNFFAPGVSVGGHTKIESHAKLGMNSVIGPNSSIPDNFDCPPLTYVNK